MRRSFIVAVAVALVCMASAPVHAVDTRNQRQSICLMVESAAKANELPVDFFARVIWQESRFDADAVGPATRSGAHAQGIAQFMPGTAAERDLLDPFDPVQALPKAAEFLHDLRTQFGNLGLAAAAYNAGPERVRRWLAGNATMPSQTRHYVWAITGHAVDDWRDAQDVHDSKAADCTTLMARLETAPNAFVTALERRVREAAHHPWGVQLAASFSRAAALSVYARAMRRFDAVLSGHDPVILHRINRSRGTRPLYQVRVGADTRGAADSLCRSLRKHGGACVVLRNG